MSDTAFEPKPLVPALDFDNRMIPAHGTTSVDFEERVDYKRLRAYRLARAMKSLEATECGAFLLFDFYNIRYTTQTWVGGALGDKMSRYALLTRDGKPHIWDFGSAAKHHQLFAPWIEPGHSHAGMLGLRGAIHPEVGLMKDAVKTIKGMLADAGVDHLPVGVDIVEPAFLFEMQAQGLLVIDIQQDMLDARSIKNVDEIMLLSQAAAMVDGVYQDITDALRPGIKETKSLLLLPRNYSNSVQSRLKQLTRSLESAATPTSQLHRQNNSPGRSGVFDIIHSYQGYRTCYYRTFSVGRAIPAQHDAYAKAREWMDAAIDKVADGVGTDEIAKLWPKAEEIGFANEMDAFGLQFGHGLGLGLHERPIISRLNSLTHPVE